MTTSGSYVCTPMYVASKKGHNKVVTTLLATDADVNQAQNDGRTPLYLACQYGRTEVVTTLLAANADVDKATSDDRTPRAPTPSS